MNTHKILWNPCPHRRHKRRRKNIYFGSEK